MNQSDLSENPLTISNGHVMAVSDDLEATDIPHRHGGDTYEGYSPVLHAAEC